MVRRLYKGLWGDGPILTSMRQFEGPVLDRSWIDRFTADRIPLDDDSSRAAFQRFNGAAELMGFLLHFDNRLGVGDHGPYHLADGGMVLARDIILNEPAFPWSQATSGLPYAITVAMFFGPDSGLKAEMMDISTVFTTPAYYLPFVRGVAVYQRQAWDTPMTEIAVLTLDDMAVLRDRCEEQSAALYGRIASMSQREKIEAGAMVYTAGFALPVARAAGMYDELVRDYGFLEIHPAVQACYDTIISGVATEMIPRLFLTGSWGNPVPEQVSDSLADGDAEFRVLHALRVRGFASPEQIAEASGLETGTVSSVLDRTTGHGHTRQRQGRISGYSLTPAGKARHVLLLGDSLSAHDASVISAAYQSFLGPNQALKQLITDWQLHPGQADAAVTAGTADRLAAVQADAVIILDQLGTVAPRFARYRGRLAAALAAFQGGDGDALAKPMTGSYHDVWMELHEDLLATLSRARTDDDG